MAGYTVSELVIGRQIGSGELKRLNGVAIGLGEGDGIQARYLG